VTSPHRPLLAPVLLALALAACGKSDPGAAGADADAEKKAHEAAITALKQPIALIAAYLPYAGYPADTGDKYTPKRHPDLEKSTLCAANEMRYAANKGRQTLETSSANATKDLQVALRNVTEACADAAEPEMLDKCGASVKALDDALAKTGAAATALGVAGAYPRVAPEAVTDEARAAIAPFLKAKGPGANDKAYWAKRSDPAASMADVIAACQTAAGDASDAARIFDKADESIRLIAVMRKIAMDSQCRVLGEIQDLRKDVNDCRKKAKSADCKIVCGKGKAAVDAGLPAATFALMEKEYTDICEKK
jgi:hypothetical protein